MNKKIKNADSGRPDLEEDFKQLRVISDDYTVPGDVCESYEAVFQMVAELDQAYREQ
jgi:regulator of cell morphogenesis and NO signaling